MLPLFIGGLIAGVAGGISAAAQADAEKKAKGAQATAFDKQREVISKNINTIKQFVEENQYSEQAIQEAMSRIGTIIDNAGEKFQSAIRIGMESSIEQMQESYGWSVEDINTQLNEFNDVMDRESKEFRTTWKEGWKKAQDTMTRRRLAGSEANIAFGKEALGKLQKGEKDIGERRSKTAEVFARQKTRLGSQLQSNIKAARQQAASQIAERMGQLELKKGVMSEAQRAQMEAMNKKLKMFGLTQGTEAELSKGLLGAKAEALSGEAAGIDPLTAGLGGAAGGLGDIAASFFYSKK